MSPRMRVNTEKAPAAFGPFSQAIKTNSFIFTSGQLPIDPDTGKVIDGDIVNQTRQVLNNLKAILNEAGSALKDVVKATVYITSMDDFQAVNEIYSEFFSDPLPARSCVEVSGLAKGAKVEIEAIALVRNS
jgi:2-iminobutanoate/2-iminopropanoate deaminase